MSINQQIPQHRFFPANDAGRDFFVGDVHGDYPKLAHAMKRQGFDPRRDRLFAMGDLVDRGPDSARVVEMLAQPWFFSVLGNHELMLLEARTDRECARLHQANGGDWYYRLGEPERSRLETLLLKHLALAFTVAVPQGQVGLVHATAPSDWRTVQEVPLEPELWHELVWDREDYNMARRDPGFIPPVAGVDLVLHGHVSCVVPWRAANRLWIDTLYRGGDLTLIPLAGLTDGQPGGQG